MTSISVLCVRENTADHTSPVNWGEANCDGGVDIADAVKVLQYIANSEKYPINEQGLANADVDQSTKGITGKDAIVIQQIDAKIYSQSDMPIK